MKICAPRLYGISSAFTPIFGKDQSRYPPLLLYCVYKYDARMSFTGVSAVCRPTGDSTLILIIVISELVVLVTTSPGPSPLFGGGT
jgi:hypothetical protein